MADSKTATSRAIYLRRAPLRTSPAHRLGRFHSTVSMPPVTPRGNWATSAAHIDAGAIDEPVPGARKRNFKLIVARTS